mmetsp:Transcript_23881/g.35805  ORF Transcript_23881/g.35805 Transcript_23881/m.35805 type:complete len:82 (+) Transcript_23881:2212-2457(+)
MIQSQMPGKMRSLRLPLPQLNADDQKVLMTVNEVSGGALYQTPRNYNQASKGKDRNFWIPSMKQEYQSLHDNGTWELKRIP